MGEALSLSSFHPSFKLLHWVNEGDVLLETTDPDWVYIHKSHESATVEMMHHFPHYPRSRNWTMLSPVRNINQVYMLCSLPSVHDVFLNLESTALTAMDCNLVECWEGGYKKTGEALSLSFFHAFPLPLPLPLPLPRLWMQLIGWDMQLHPQPWIGKPKPINKQTNQPTNKPI